MWNDEPPVFVLSIYLSTDHQPAARLFLIIPARFFDALLKMLNRKFRMKIVPGEAFFNK